MSRQITVIACVLELWWNFEPFALARTTKYMDGLKTHSRHVKGAHFGPKALGTYEDLRLFQKVFLWLSYKLLISSLQAPYKLLTSPWGCNECNEKTMKFQ